MTFDGIDQGTASVIAALFVFLGVVVSTRRASRDGVQQAQEVQQAKAQVVAEALPFAENLDLVKYIRDEVRAGVEAETAQIRADREQDRVELNDMKRILVNAYDRVDRLRHGFLQHIDHVRRDWGKADQPPPVAPHMVELLQESDGDTWTRIRIQQLRDSVPPDEPEPPQSYG
jgi:hypothetical protein